MDGRNSFGRRISLLNDDVPTITRKSSTTARFSPSFSSVSSSSSSSRLPSFAHSRASSSGASTPCLSPQTPPLIRSNSLDSSDMDVPSPITPDYHPEGLESLPGIAPQTTSQLYPPAHSAYFAHPPKDALSSYPPVPSHSIPLPYPHHAQQPNAPLPYAPVVQNHHNAVFDSRAVKSQQPIPVQPQRRQQQQQQPPQPTQQQKQQQQPQPQPQPQQQQQQAELGARSVPQTNRTKKGQHPCPLAKQFNCSDTFTTSGHASRHAKKHTGEKSAVCPDCGKDFTRKDNMEQHRKTHLNGRNANKGRAADSKSSSRQQPASKRPKPSPLQSSSAAGSSPMALQQQLPDFVAPSQEAGPIPTYPDPAACSASLAYPSVPHDALHTLARAASVEGRRFVG